MPTPFCHLHNHTEYSLLDGANRIPEMVAKSKELGMDALAISDHGVMFGVMEFYQECKKKGVKPILGVEAYVSPQGIAYRGTRSEKDMYHLLLLAKDLEGYRNLCKLSTIAALEGYYHRPRIDHDLLRKHSQGVIGTSACIGSEVCKALLAGDYQQAQYVAGMYKEIFRGDFFIELQDHGLPEQHRIKDDLVRISKELKLPLIATNDAHYLCKADAHPHDVLLCIQTGAQMADEKRMRFSTQEFYLKSPEEMALLFPGNLDALENTRMVADMCNVELPTERAPMPQPVVPEGMTSVEYLRHLAEEGLKVRSKRPEESLARLHYELDVITRTDYQDYFLLVREFAEATRQRGIYFGVRGSAAGSLVSYAVGITDVDPVEYDLTFERFLNPERISMPDIDMDFEDARRDEIIQYVTERFGKDHVAQIVTFGTLGAKAAIKDCGRVLGYSPQETDRLTKTIPSAPGTTLDKALEESREFKDLVLSEPRYQQLLEDARQVEGMARHVGVHAAGVVISRDPLVDYVPLYRGGTEGQAVTAYDMGILDKIGLLKMDFLGLSNLTVLARAVENIHRSQEAAGTPANFDIHSIPECDEKTFDMLGRGETTGVFQLESSGMTRYVMQLKPANVRELAAMIALFRPGPMEHIPAYIDAKFGRAKPKFLDERMRPILEETYGVIVYQDQVLKLVQALAGFSLGKADVLRKAMGKKDAALMAEMMEEFFAGTSANGLSRKHAEEIWELLKPFAGYAFNKAHAVCYSLLAYQTAYLKANYPVEYMAGILSVYLAREAKVTAFIEECRRMKIPVLPPDVNQSVGDFSIEACAPTAVVGAKRRKGTATSAIRFGLVAIKGVGEGLVEGIVKERLANGRFVHLYEFCDRTKALGMNRTAAEALIRAGALDSIDRNRRRLLNHVEAALQYADAQNRSRLNGQDSLFGGDGDAPGQHPLPVLPDCPMPDRSELLAMEKEVMGIYVSDHPLRGHEATIQRASTHTCASVADLEDGEFVKLAGVIANLRSIVTKSKGERMATIVLEDFSGQAGCIVFPKVFERLRDQLIKDSVVQLSGYVMHREMRGEKSVEVRLEDLKPLDGRLDLGFSQGSVEEGLVRLQLRRATEGQMLALRRVVEEHPGDYALVIQVLPESDFAPIYLAQHIQPNDSFRRAVKEALTHVEVEVLHSGTSEEI